MQQNAFSLGRTTQAGQSLSEHRLVWKAIRASWLLPLILVVASICYSAVRGARLEYWDAAIGNLLATLLGIIAGVPIALFLERRRAVLEHASRTSEATKDRRDVLEVLLVELVRNRRMIHNRQTLADSISLESLHTARWEALSAAGSLRHVAQPAILGALADAYRATELLKAFEERAMSAVYGVNCVFPDGQNAAQKLLVHAQTLYAPTLAALDRAVVAIADQPEASTFSQRIPLMPEIANVAPSA